MRKKSYCVVLKRHCIVCYCIASVPVCVFCDGRTHGQTHNPILSGIRCFLRRNATTQQRRNNDANSQIIVLIVCYYCECARLCFLRRTDARTHTPILSGIRCFLRTDGHALANNSIDIESDFYYACVRSLLNQNSEHTKRKSKSSYLN